MSANAASMIRSQSPRRSGALGGGEPVVRVRRPSRAAPWHDRSPASALSPPTRASAPLPPRPHVRAVRQAALGHQHIERGARRAARAGHVFAQPRRALVARCRASSPASGHGLRASRSASSGGNPTLSRRPRPALRSAERHRLGRCPRRRLPRRATPRPRPRCSHRSRQADASQSRLCAGGHRAIAQATVIARPIAAGVLGIARTIAASPEMPTNTGRSSYRRRSTGTPSAARTQRR